MADTDPAIVAQAEAAGETLDKVKNEIGKAVFGQERVIELALSAILAGGHALLIHGLGILLILGRLIHALGISRENENYRLRVTGMALTFTALCSAALRCIIYAVT